MALVMRPFTKLKLRELPAGKDAKIGQLGQAPGDRRRPSPGRSRSGSPDRRARPDCDRAGLPRESRRARRTPSTASARQQISAAAPARGAANHRRLHPESASTSPSQHPLAGRGRGSARGVVSAHRSPGPRGGERPPPELIPCSSGMGGAVPSSSPAASDGDSGFESWGLGSPSPGSGPCPSEFASCP